MSEAGSNSLRKPIERLEERLVAQNEYVEMYLDQVRIASSGVERSHARIVHSSGGVVVLPRNPQSELYLHRAYRYAADVSSLEFLRGFLEPGEEPRTAALRELDEEANFEASVIGDARLLGHIRPDATLLASRIPVFIVDIENPTPAPVDPQERPEEGWWYSLADIETRVRNGGIDDGFTLAAYSLLVIHERYIRHGS